MIAASRDLLYTMSQLRTQPTNTILGLHFYTGTTRRSPVYPRVTAADLDYKIKKQFLNANVNFKITNAFAHDLAQTYSRYY